MVLFRNRKYYRVGGETGLKGWRGEEKFMSPVLDGSGKTVKEVVCKLI